MTQVICKSMHARFHDEIGGVRFFDSPVGRISVDITDGQAEEFLRTPQFFVRHTGDPVALEGEPPAGSESDASDDLDGKGDETDESLTDEQVEARAKAADPKKKGRKATVPVTEPGF